MHCTTSVDWYIGKFLVNIVTILFIYEGFFKEKQIDCVCGAGERQLNRHKNSKTKSRSRCVCKHWKKSIYQCGCRRKALIDECTGKRPSITKIPDDLEKIKKPSCCCGN